MTKGDIFIARARQQGRRDALAGKKRQKCHWCYVLRAVNYSPVYPDDLRKDVDFQDHIFRAYYQAFDNAFRKGDAYGSLPGSHQGRRDSAHLAR